MPSLAEPVTDATGEQYAPVDNSARVAPVGANYQVVEEPNLDVSNV